MVDPERLHRLLRRVTDDLGTLQGYASLPEQELLPDPVRLGHVKYVFVTMLEGCIDAAQHVCAAQGYGPVDSNAAAMLLLARHGALTSELAVAMAQAVRFRNVLVHGYAQVDERRVVAYLSELGDISAFVAAMSDLIVD